MKNKNSDSSAKNKKLIQAIQIAIEKHYNNKMLRSYLEEILEDIDETTFTVETFEDWLADQI